MIKKAKTAEIESANSAALRNAGAVRWSIVDVNASEKAICLMIKEIRLMDLRGATKLGVVLLP